MAMAMAESQVHVFRKKLGKLADFVGPDDMDVEQVSSSSTGTANPNSQQEVLFKEFFSSNFSRTLAQVKDVKKLEFAQELDKHLHAKFDPITQVPYLDCLVSFLIKGKDMPETHEKARRCVQKVLDRMDFDTDVPDEYHMNPKADKNDLMAGFLAAAQTNAQLSLKDYLPDHTTTSKALKEIEGAAFTQVWSVLGKDDQTTFTKDILAKTYVVNLTVQREIVQRIAPAREYVEKEIVFTTSQLNSWLKHVPKYPATPHVLGDLFLLCLKSKNCPLYRAITDKVARERFLIAISLAVHLVLDGKGTNAWLCVANPILRRQAYDLQHRFFNVNGNMVMAAWLKSRIETLNKELITNLVEKPGNLDVYSHLLPLFKKKFEPTEGKKDQSAIGKSKDEREKDMPTSTLLPPMAAGDPPDKGWVPSDLVIRDLEQVLLQFVETFMQDRWFCPHHVLSLPPILKVFSHYGLIELSRMEGSSIIKVRRPPPQDPSAAGAPGTVGANNPGAASATNNPNAPAGTHPAPFGSHPAVFGHGQIIGPPPGMAPGEMPLYIQPDGTKGPGKPFKGGIPPPGFKGGMMIPPGMAVPPGGFGGGFPPGYRGLPGAKGGFGLVPGQMGMVPGYPQIPPGAAPPGLAQPPPGSFHPSASSTGVQPPLQSKAIPPHLASQLAQQEQLQQQRPKYMTKAELNDFSPQNIVDLLVREVFLKYLNENESWGLKDSVLELTKVPQMDDSWMICGIEVTLQARDGQLFVYKSNAATRNMSIQDWIDNDLCNTLIAKGLKAPTRGLATKLGETGIGTKVVAGPGELPPPIENDDAAVLDPISGMLVKNGLIFSTSDRVVPINSGDDPGFVPASEKQQDLKPFSSGDDDQDHGPNSAAFAQSGLPDLDKAIFPDSLWEDQQTLGALVRHLVKKKICDEEWKALCLRYDFKDASAQDPRRHQANTLKHFITDTMKKDKISGEKNMVSMCADFLTAEKEKKNKREKAAADKKRAAEEKKREKEEKDKEKEKRGRKKRKRGDDSDSDAEKDNKPAKRGAKKVTP
ncbi:unnamed protein product [Amoebophrya sp. A120]|nr:unnamed protein product [Amoebophrya sp. A120]|eukprot:GSA120T00022662001.1